MSQQISYTLPIILKIGLFLIIGTSCQDMNPSFRTTNSNISVVIGQTAVLPCSIANKGKYRVVWTDQFSSLITYEEGRIIDDVRFSVERPFVGDWDLHIRHVRLTDRGRYVCQVNTSPVLTQHVNLTVLVPPILSEMHTSENPIIAQEGSTIKMVCNATGVPRPYITWYKSPDNVVQRTEVEGPYGEVLTIQDINRDDGGTYKCIASNGVLPTASSIFQVLVQYLPKVHFENITKGAQKGKAAILACKVEAYPLGKVKWFKAGAEIETIEGEVHIDVFTESFDRMESVLLIAPLEEKDFGEYTCEATNTLGRDKEIIILYDSLDITTTSDITTIYKVENVASLLSFNILGWLLSTAVIRCSS